MPIMIIIALVCFTILGYNQVESLHKINIKVKKNDKIGKNNLNKANYVNANSNDIKYIVK